MRTLAFALTLAVGQTRARSRAPTKGRADQAPPKHFPTMSRNHGATPGLLPGGRKWPDPCPRRRGGATSRFSSSGVEGRAVAKLPAPGAVRTVSIGHEGHRREPQGTGTTRGLALPAFTARESPDAGLKELAKHKNLRCALRCSRLVPHGRDRRGGSRSLAPLSRASPRFNLSSTGISRRRDLKNVADHEKRLPRHGAIARHQGDGRRA